MNIFPRRSIPIISALLGGAILSFATFHLVRKNEAQTLKAEFEQHAANRVNSLRREIDANLETVQSLYSLYKSSNGVTREEFGRFTASAIERHPSVQALEWIPRVPLDERSAYESAAAAEGFSGFVITERLSQGRMARTGNRDEYFPVYYVEPYKGNEIALGFDLASEEVRAAALRKARDTGRITASGRITLVQETEHHYGFIVFIPIYGPGPEPANVPERRARLRGFVLGVFRTVDMAEKAWSYLGEDGLDVRISDAGGSPGMGMFLDYRLTERGGGNGLNHFVYSQTLKVADRDWAVILRPTSEFFADKPSGKSILILLFGAFLTLMLAAYLKMNQTRAARTEELLEKYAREAEERARAEGSLKESEARFRRIAENIPDAIFRWSVEKGLEYVSPNVEKITGYRADDLMNDPMMGLKLVSSQYPEIVADYENAVAGGPVKTPREVFFIRKDGQKVWLEVKAIPVKDENQRIMAFEGLLSDITGRRLAEKTLRENEERFRTLFQGINEGIIVHDPDGVILDVNAATCERLKYDRWELVGLNVRDIVSPGAAELVSDRIERTEKEGKTFFETVYRIKDGGEIYCEVSERTLRYAGRPAMLSVSRDVTDRRKAEKALRDSEDRYRVIIDAITNYVYTVVVENGAPVRTTHSPGCVAVTGYSPEEYEEDTDLWLGMVYAEDRAGVGEWARRNLAGERTSHIEHRIVRKDGQERWIRNVLIPRHGEDGALKTYEGIIEDITDRKLAELEIHRNFVCQSVLNGLLRIPLMEISPEEGLEKILKSICGIPWLELEPRGMIFRFDDNDGALKLAASIGLPESLKSSCERVLPNECFCGSAASSGEIIFADDSDVSRKPLKSCSPCTHCCVPIARNGNTVGVITLYTTQKRRPECRELEFLKAVADIIALAFEHDRMEKDRNDLREQLLQSQKMEAVGELAGGVAHDFNNMLTVIMGNAQMGAMIAEPADEHRLNYDAIIGAAERAKDLTMKLLTFARKEKLNLKDVSINDILGDLAKVLERSYQKKIRINMKLKLDMPKSRIDKNQVYQGLLNICNNARDAMPSGGTLTIGTDEIVLDEKYCARNPDAAPGMFCVIAISDTGVGMSEDVKKRIFEPFFTTKGEGKGTGLGLSVTYGVMKNHGGFIQVESGTDKGTCFRIFLPASLSETPAESGNDEAWSVGGSETILIVDDEETVLNLTARMLSAHGYRPIKAGSGKQAVEIYGKRRSDIDLIILDMIMPDMDGRDVYEKIRAMDRDARIILSSGFSMNGQVSREMIADIKGFVQKPFNISELLATVRKAFNNNKAAALRI